MTTSALSLILEHLLTPKLEQLMRSLPKLTLCALCSLTWLACSEPAQDPIKDQGQDQAPSVDMKGLGDMTQDLSPTPDQGDEDMAQDMAESNTITLPPQPWDITKMGPYKVGYQLTELTYKAKPNDRERTLELAIWYPTLQREGRAARYLKVLTRREVIDGPPIAPEGKFPVMVFSHGNGSLGEQSYFMTEYFTSHGWIVLAPYHTNNTVKDNVGSVNYRSSLDRPQDITAVIDWLEDVPEDHILYQRYTEELVLSGHSFGGYTTLASAGASFSIDKIIEACAQGQIEKRLCDAFSDEQELNVFREGFADKRIKVAIPQTPAGAFFFGDGVKQITTPTLLMTGALDRSLPNAQEGDPIWENLTGSRAHLRLDFKRGGHFTFSNMCELFPSIEQVENDGCSEDFIPFMDAFPIINLYAMAFVRFHLFADMSQNGLLTGEEQPYREQVTFSSKR